MAILGVGPIGMSVFHALRTREIGRVYVTDKIAERLTFARHLHAAWCGNPDHVDVVGEISTVEALLLDAVYECSGDPAAVSQGVHLLKPGGTLVLVGIPETDTVAVPIHELRRKEVTIINIRRQCHCTQKAIDLLARHTADIGSLVTHRFRLEETQGAFDLVARYGDGVMRAVISVG